MFSWPLQNRLKEKLVVKEVVGEAERLDCKDKGVMVLVELLLDSESELLSRAKANKALLQRVCSSFFLLSSFFFLSFLLFVDIFCVLICSVFRQQ